MPAKMYTHTTAPPSRKPAAGSGSTRPSGFRRCSFRTNPKSAAHATPAIKAKARSRPAQPQAQELLEPCPYPDRQQRGRDENHHESRNVEKDVARPGLPRRHAGRTLFDGRRHFDHFVAVLLTSLA